MDLLSGLLLVAVIAWILYIVARELLDERINQATSRYFRSASNPVEENLIGTAGEVIENTTGNGDQFRVRIGMELWSAKLMSTTNSSVQIGTRVKVIAINGMVLDVEEDLSPEQVEGSTETPA